MSGAEFIAVTSVISSIIAIVDGIKQVVDAASEVEGLPKAFRQASNKLLLISDILDATTRNFETDNVSGVEKSVTLVVNGCKNKWKTLKDLFDKVIPEEEASRVERYYRAVKTLGKGGKVESLMKGMLEDIQLLANIKTITTTNIEKDISTATAAQEEKVAKAIKDVAAWQSSVPDDVFQEEAYTFNNVGTGQYIALGNAKQNISGGESRQYNSSGGSQIINEAQTIVNGILNIPLLQTPKNDESQACLTALFLTYPRDDREKLIQMKGSRVNGTCEWIRTNELYDSWLKFPSQLLWLSGGPGKGKTMLSIFLAEELERTTNDSQSTFFLQYFCDNKDEKRNTAVAVIRGLMLQLLQLQPKLFGHILPSFQIQKESLFTDSSFETLWRIFSTMLHDPVLGNIYCVLDGLDECDEASLHVLLIKLKALFSPEAGPSHRLKMIVLSRELPKFIPQLLSGVPRVRLDPDADSEVNDNIRRFITERVEHLPAYQRCSETLRIHVKEVFQQRAQGTFLWVSLVAKALEKCEATEIKKALDQFPPGLDELYARMLLQIDDTRRPLAAKMLLWIVMATRPLTLSELGTAVGIDAKPSDGFDFADIVRDQVSYCGSFLAIQADKVGLIHQSAKDYLLRETPDSNPELEVFRVKKEIANLEITRKCLDYLQNGALANGKVDLRNDTAHLKAFPLLSYAALHWPEHARSLARSEDIFDLSHPFYHEKSRVRASWLKTYWAMHTEDKWPKSFTLLHLASSCNILPLAQNLLLNQGLINWVKRLLYLNKKDDNGWTALFWAARNEHEAMVRLLLEKGAETEAKDRHGETVLMWAVRRENKVIVQLLLEKGAGTRAMGWVGMTALMWAVRRGNEAIVQLLLEKGADIEAKDEDGKTALMWAVQDGNEAIVRLLLEKGADIEAKDKDGKTALTWAVWDENEAIVQLLLEKGADIEAKSKDRETVLIWAVLGRNEAIVQLLLEKGADIEAKNKNGETALTWAVWFNNEVIVQLLSEKGVDIEAMDEDRETALIWAVRGRNEAIVQLLLEKGADIEAKSKDGETVLIWAVQGRNEAIVQLLLEKGVDIEAMDEDRETALIWAVRGRNEAIVQLLLEKGADIEAKNKHGKTVLDIAAEHRYEDIVQLLSKKGGRRGSE